MEAGELDHALFHLCFLFLFMFQGGLREEKNLSPQMNKALFLYMMNSMQLLEINALIAHFRFYFVF